MSLCNTTTSINRIVSTCSIYFLTGPNGRILLDFGASSGEVGKAALAARRGRDRLHPYRQRPALRGCGTDVTADQSYRSPASRAKRFRVVFTRSIPFRPPKCKCPCISRSSKRRGYALDGGRALQRQGEVLRIGMCRLSSPGGKVDSWDASRNRPVNKRDLSTGENGETDGESEPVGRGDGGSSRRPSARRSKREWGSSDRAMAGRQGFEPR